MCARPTWRAASMARQTPDPFERIWPIKRGLRAALSSGLTQSTGFLSSRPPPLRTTPPPLPSLALHPALCVIPGCIRSLPSPPRLVPSPRWIRPPPARVLLPRHPRPFQSMSSRQRAFRYFEKPRAGSPIPPGDWRPRWFSDRDFSGGCSIYSRRKARTLHRGR